jgi:hypothetical protein
MDEDYRYIPVTEHMPTTPTLQVVLRPEAVQIIVAEGGEERRPVLEDRDVPQTPRISITVG